ncbi:hypothetical protein Patl1_32596 [Pistacia atlantica]|uniref:Uncharacterized protein n=1 Tax=Pistacia atlantica TaxID=434234 RepID=A0ACC1AP73_9ROSI|nr:hypothetical protein Patl1_32596 [Pistacia atlantica]
MLPPANCACPVSKVTKEHEETQKVMQFLMGLNESYSAVRSSILLMNPLPTVNIAYLMINQEEKQGGITSTKNKQKKGGTSKIPVANHSESAMMDDPHKTSASVNKPSNLHSSSVPRNSQTSWQGWFKYS